MTKLLEQLFARDRKIAGNIVDIEKYTHHHDSSRQRYTFWGGNTGSGSCWYAGCCTVDSSCRVGTGSSAECCAGRIPANHQRNPRQFGRHCPRRTPMSNWSPYAGWPRHIRTSTPLIHPDRFVFSISHVSSLKNDRVSFSTRTDLSFSSSCIIIHSMYQRD